MNIETLMQTIISYLSDPNVIGQLTSIFIIGIACFLICGLFRLIFGHKNILVCAVSTVLGILILYCIRILLAPQLETLSFLSDLPFVRIETEILSLLSYKTLDSSIFYAEFLRLILLVFLFGLFEDIFPEGKNLFVWLLLRAIGIIAAFCTFTLLEFLTEMFLPGFILTYATTVLLALLILLLAVTLLKWLVGLILGVTAGPLIGGIYTFFVSHIVGKQLTKSALTSCVLLAMIQLAEHFNKTTVLFNDSIHFVLITVILVLIVFRYLFKKIF